MSQQNVETEEKASTVAVLAAGLSILYSWYTFYLQGDKVRGVFVGLWAPTILAIATYVEVTGLTEKAEEKMES